MQLRLDAADRLVELVEEQGGVLPVEEAAQSLFALARAPAGLARDLLADVVAADSRLDWRSGRSVALAGSQLSSLPLEAATYVVVDLETTGLGPGRARICEIGAVRVRGLELAAAFETLVDPAVALPAGIAALTGLSD
ncbi:MAG TPA: exonuclease domain-containing protein, partial [Gaiellaceae bacterium]|nr:exonuclease domain-containing protein [Gaiellaceae bacterium]